MKKLFAPGNDSAGTSLALLVLRLWLGITMLMNHGVDKLRKFSDLRSGFPDPLAIGHGASLGLTLFAEVAAALLLIVGLTTRFAALVLAIDMTIAFFMVHHAALKGAHSGELALIYLAGFITLLIAGPGRMSVDQNLFGGSGKVKAKKESAK